MIGISTITQNAAGSVVLYLTPTQLKDNTARVSRVATLDGACVLNHFGVSDSDRTIRVVGSISKTLSDKLWAIFNLGEKVNVSTEDGFWRAAISLLKVDAGQLNMTILIEEALHE